MPKTDSDPEVLKFLRWITVLFLGGWLINTGLDWSTTLLLDSEGAYYQGVVRVLVLALGFFVILKSNRF